MEGAKDETTGATPQKASLGPKGRLSGQTVLNPMKTLSLQQKRQWLIAKGYESARTGDQKFVESLYGMYQKPKHAVRAAPKEWKMWSGTFRPHHCR